MRRVSDGYTIIEVMIFLAISVVIAGAAMNLISGKQAETDFNQKARDTQSKIQDWINDVSDGNTGGDPSQQYCMVSGSRPQIITPPPAKPANYSPNCTFLGKAIQFTDSNPFGGGVPNQESTIYAYPVFGCLDAGCPASPNNQLPANMFDANPEPAIGPAPLADLTQSFDLTPAHVQSVCGIPQGSASCNGSHLVGFMNSFNTGSSLANGAEDLNVFLYNLRGNMPPANQGGSRVVNCLEANVPRSGSCRIRSGQNPPSLKSFKACLTDGRRYVDLTITSGNGIGATVDLTYVSAGAC